VHPMSKPLTPYETIPSHDAHLRANAARNIGVGLPLRI
jgi:hypothetical protein